MASSASCCLFFVSTYPILLFWNVPLALLLTLITMHALGQLANQSTVCEKNVFSMKECFNLKLHHETILILRFTWGVGTWNTLLNNGGNYVLNFGSLGLREFLERFRGDLCVCVSWLESVILYAFTRVVSMETWQRWSNCTCINARNCYA